MSRSRSVGKHFSRGKNGFGDIAFGDIESEDVESEDIAFEDIVQAILCVNEKVTLVLGKNQFHPCVKRQSTIDAQAFE
jgi:hypothetical protein